MKIQNNVLIITTKNQFVYLSVVYSIHLILAEICLRGQIALQALIVSAI